MATVFTRIIEGELPGHFVWRDDQAVVFLSINPIARGHALVVPVAEIDHWLDLDPAQVCHLTTVAHTVGRAQMDAFGPDRVGLIVAGFEVPHVHLHVIPTMDMSDLDFGNAARSVDAADLASAADELRAALRAQGAPHVVDG